MNTNFLHNILNIAIALIASASAFDWTVIISPTASATIISGLAITKLVINAVRDGLGGMVAVQPPVQK